MQYFAKWNFRTSFSPYRMESRTSSTGLWWRPWSFLPIWIQPPLTVILLTPWTLEASLLFQSLEQPVYRYVVCILHVHVRLVYITVHTVLEFKIIMGFKLYNNYYNFVHLFFISLYKFQMINCNTCLVHRAGWDLQGLWWQHLYS